MDNVLQKKIETQILDENSADNRIDVAKSIRGSSLGRVLGATWSVIDGGPRLERVTVKYDGPSSGWKVELTPNAVELRHENYFTGTYYAPVRLESQRAKGFLEILRGREKRIRKLEESDPNVKAVKELMRMLSTDIRLNPGAYTSSLPPQELKRQVDNRLPLIF